MPTRQMPIRGALALVVLLVTTVLFTMTSHAAPPSNNPSDAAEYGAAWAATQVNAQGFVSLPDASPNVTATLETALALGVAGVDRPTFDLVMAWATANVSTIIVAQGSDSAGTLGELLMLADMAGIDPTGFGGQNLLAHLAGTFGDFTPGLYGAQDPTYDGVYRQSLALLGLAAAGVAPPPTALAWLAEQQCVGLPADATGGWEPYRADPAAPCQSPDPVLFVGPDSNSTAMAVQALDAFGLLAPQAAALDFLASIESSTGGFAFIPGLDDDPNSTALVILAIVAGGENPQAGRWLKGPSSPVTSLLSWQLGCSAPVADRGAFASPFSSGSPDGFATRQAVWGAGLEPFPFGPPSFHPAAVPCQPTTTPSTTATSASSSPSSTNATNPTTTLVGVRNQATASPVVAVPRFTG